MKMQAILPWPQRSVTSKVVRPYHPLRFVQLQAEIQGNTGFLISLRRMTRKPRSIEPGTPRQVLIDRLSVLSRHEGLHTGKGPLL